MKKWLLGLLALISVLPAFGSQWKNSLTGTCLEESSGDVLAKTCVTHKTEQKSVMVPVAVGGVTYYNWIINGKYIKAGPATTGGAQTKYYIKSDPALASSDDFLWSTYKATDTATTLQFENKAAAGRCLNIEQDSTTSGAKVELWACRGARSKEFARQDFLQPMGNSEFRPVYPIVDGKLGKSLNLQLQVGSPCDCGAFSQSVLCKIVGYNSAGVCRSLEGLEVAWLGMPVAVSRAPVTVAIATSATVSGTGIEGGLLTGTPASFTNYSGTVTNGFYTGNTLLQSGITYTLQNSDVGKTIDFISLAGTVSSKASYPSPIVAAAGGGGGGGGGGTAPSTNVVPFFSTNWPVGSGLTNPNWGPYPLRNMAGGIMCLNNIWGFVAAVSTARQSMGCQTGTNGGVDMRTAGSSNGASSREVLSYPSSVFGQTPSSTPASQTTVLPKRIGLLNAATVSYQKLEGNMTFGQFVTDAWVTTIPNCTYTACRKLELMWEFQPYGGYNAPAPWSPGGADRAAADQGKGPSENAVYFRTTVSGTLVDVYVYPPSPWRLIKLFPFVFPKAGPTSMNMKAVVDMLVSRGYATNNDYLGAIEVGWEPVVKEGAITFDSTVRGLRIDVN